MALSPNYLSFNWDNTDTTGGIAPGAIKVGHYGFGSFLQMAAKDDNGIDVASWVTKLAGVVDTDNPTTHPISQHYTPNKTDNISLINANGSRVQPQAGYAGGKAVRITLTASPSPSSTPIGQWDIKHVERLGAPAPALDSTQTTDLNSMSYINLRNLWAYNAVASGMIAPAYFSTYHMFVVNNPPPAGCTKVVFDSLITLLKQSIKSWYVLAKYSGNLYSLALSIEKTTPVYITVNDRNVAAYNNYRNYWGGKALECGQFTFETISAYYLTVVNNPPSVGGNEATFNTRIEELKQSIYNWYVASGFSNVGNSFEKLRQLIEFTTPPYMSFDQPSSYDPNVEAFNTFKYTVLNYIYGRVNIGADFSGSIFANNTGQPSLDPDPISTYNSVLTSRAPAPGVSESVFNTEIDKLYNAIVNWFKRIVFWRNYEQTLSTQGYNKLQGSGSNAILNKPWYVGKTGMHKYSSEYVGQSNEMYYVTYSTEVSSVEGRSYYYVYSLDKAKLQVFIETFLNKVKPAYINIGTSRFTDPLAPAVTVNTLGAMVTSGRKTVIPKNIIFKFNQMRQLFSREAGTYVSGWTGDVDANGAKIYGPLLQGTGFANFSTKITKFNNAINGTTADSELLNTDYYQSSIELSNGAATTIIAPTTIPQNTTVYLHASIPYDTTLTGVTTGANSITVRYSKNVSPYVYKIAVYNNGGTYLGEAAGSLTHTESTSQFIIRGYRKPAGSVLDSNTDYKVAIIPYANGTPLYDITVVPFGCLNARTTAVAASGGETTTPILTDEVGEAPGQEPSPSLETSIIAPASSIASVQPLPSTVLDQIAALTSGNVLSENIAKKAAVAGAPATVGDLIGSSMGPTTPNGHTVSSLQLASSSTPDAVHLVLEETEQTPTNYAGVKISINKYTNKNKIQSDTSNSATFDTVKTTFNHIAPFTLTRTDDNGIQTDIGTITLSANTSVPFTQNLSYPGSYITIHSLDITNDRFEVTLHAPFTTYGQNPQGTPPPVPCFPAGTRILTPNGYQAVQNLRNGDTVVTSTGKTVPVRIYSTYISSTTEKTAPYLIPANTFGSSQKHAVRLSPLHAINISRGLWDIPMYAAERYPAIRQYGLGEQVTYYHIEAPNFFQDNLVIEGGVVVESFAGRQCDGLKEIYTFNHKRGGFTRATQPTSSVIAKRG